MPYLPALRHFPFACAIAFALSLLGLAAAIRYGFSAGPVNETHRVTVVHVIDHNVQIPATPGGPRIGGSPAHSVREYRVMCTTLSGQACVVVTEPHVQYHVGELITAEVELNKPEGTFGWTFNSRLCAGFGLIALLWGLWRGRKAWARPTPMPPPSPAAPRPSAPMATEPCHAALLRAPKEQPWRPNTGEPNDPTHFPRALSSGRFGENGIFE